MDPITMMLLSMIPSLIGGGVNVAQGIMDKREAEDIKEKAGPRPKFEIPDSVGKMINMYEQLAGGGMPGEDLMRDDIQASTARDITAIGQLSDSSVGALGALGASKQREHAAIRDLGIRSAQYQAQQQQNLARAYGQQANWENLQWDYNKNQPWQIAQNEYWGLRQGARSAFNQGVDTAMSGATGAIGGAAQMGMYGSMMPNYNTQQPPLAGTPPPNTYGTPPDPFSPYPSGGNLGGEPGNYSW